MNNECNVMNLEYIKVSLFEISYQKKKKCTCICSGGQTKLFAWHFHVF